MPSTRLLTSKGSWTEQDECVRKPDKNVEDERSPTLGRPGALIRNVCANLRPSNDHSSGSEMLLGREVGSVGNYSIESGRDEHELGQFT